MEPEQELINKWQNFWERLCRMAYYREGVVKKLEVYIGDIDEYMKIKNCNYFPLTLSYMWSKTSNESISDTQLVEELEHLFVPRILFETLGVYTWFEYTFPNCKIEFWEDN
jgi:hypothetical protein